VTQRNAVEDGYLLLSSMEQDKNAGHLSNHIFIFPILFHKHFVFHHGLNH